MVPVLVPSSAVSPLTLSSVVDSSPLTLSSFVPASISGAASPRGRKRTNDCSDSSHLFSKRHSNSDLSDDDSTSTPRKGSPGPDDERRAHHNELERRRRDHIKDHFMCLKDAIPLLEGEKSSRALILKRAVEYISLMQSRLHEHQMAIDELKRRNEQLSAGLLDKSSSCRTVATPVTPVSPVTSPSILSIPTTSAAPVLALPSISIDSMSKPSSSSPFTPVVPSKSSMSPLRFAAPSPSAAPAPVLPSMTELAMLLAINSKNQENQMQKDLAALISLNNLALKEVQGNPIVPVSSAHHYVPSLLF